MNDDLISKKPLKSGNLKVIDHVGVLYGTVDNQKLWEIDKVAWEILKMCDGSKTVDQIIWTMSKRFEVDMEEVKPIVLAIVNELVKINFVELKN
ncbi:MAG: PqqD family protein [Candidatus Aenigmatarchaeota archaeon]